MRRMTIAAIAALLLAGCSGTGVPNYQGNNAIGCLVVDGKTRCPNDG
jgi:PBP1b-binding outer membrane lipoprotein LpoB